MSYDNYNGLSERSQERRYRRIEWMRRATRWLRKCMIIVIVLLAIAVILSYIFITKEPEPQEIEYHKSLLIRD